MGSACSSMRASVISVALAGAVTETCEGAKGGGEGNARARAGPGARSRNRRPPSVNRRPALVHPRRLHYNGPVGVDSGRALGPRCGTRCGGGLWGGGPAEPHQIPRTEGGGVFGAGGNSEGGRSRPPFANLRPSTASRTAMHWKGGTPPPPGAQPMPSHCPPNAKCPPQWHLQPTVTAPNRFGNLLQPPA